MADDWQVGDLAVCVTTKRCPLCERTDDLFCLKVGNAYHVSGVTPDPLGPILDMAEFPADPWWGFCHLHFRKIRPDEHEACEAEFVTLLKRSKKPVSA